MEKKILVLNASSGISGDMTVGALLDLGADQDVLRTAIDSLHLEGARIEISRVKKSALDACDFDVILDAEHENHDHDMAYLHPGYHDHEHHHDHEDHDHAHHDHEHHHDHESHDHENHDHEHHHDHEDHDHEHHHDHEDHDHEHHDHEHHHDHESHDHENHDHEHHDHEHHHDHGHDHEHGHHHHGRNLTDIEAILRSGSLTDRALELALKIFSVVAQAESRVHGEPVERVHFHEVGAVDSIIDIAAAAVCIDNLGITDVIVTDLSEGTGTVMCQHGLLPVPVPATAQILSAHQIPFGILEYVRGELITPTGAAILAALDAGNQMPARFRILRTGLGAGKREYATAGVLRAMLIEPDKSSDGADRFRPEAGFPDEDGDGKSPDRDRIIKLETNIDDSTGEALGAVMELLMEAGAKDVYFIPAYMKKHRPAYILNVICRPDDRERLEEIIFRNTTTIGIREMICARTVLPRRSLSVETPWGKADAKECRIGGEKVIYPEAESVKKLSREHGIGYPEMYHQIKEFLRLH